MHKTRIRTLEKRIPDRKYPAVIAFHKDGLYYIHQDHPGYTEDEVKKLPWYGRTAFAVIDDQDGETDLEAVNLYLRRPHAAAAN